MKDTSGPAIVNHYNLFPSAEITGVLAPVFYWFIMWIGGGKKKSASTG